MMKHNKNYSLTKMVGSINRVEIREYEGGKKPMTQIFKMFIPKKELHRNQGSQKKLFLY